MSWDAAKIFFEARSGLRNNVLNQCDQIATLFWNFGHLRQFKFAQKYTKFAKVGSKICRIINKPSKNSQYFESFAKVAKFSQILSHFFK